jgi:hypothetical protein
MVFPRIARYTVGAVAVGTRKYIDWLAVLYRYDKRCCPDIASIIPFTIRYVALTGWTLAVWISFQPLINTRQVTNASQNDVAIINLLAKLLFALFLCAAVLLGEKFAIQWIAGKFHERSYAGELLALRLRNASLSTHRTRTHRGSKVCSSRAFNLIPTFT